MIRANIGKVIIGTTNGDRHVIYEEGGLHRASATLYVPPEVADGEYENAGVSPVVLTDSATGKVLATAATVKVKTADGTVHTVETFPIRK